MYSVPNPVEGVQGLRGFCVVLRGQTKTRAVDPVHEVCTLWGLYPHKMASGHGAGWGANRWIEAMWVT